MKFNEKTRTYQYKIVEIFDCVNNLYCDYDFCGGFVNVIYNRADEQEIARTDGYRVSNCIDNVNICQDYFDEYDILVLLGGKIDISPLVFRILELQYEIEYINFKLHNE